MNTCSKCINSPNEFSGHKLDQAFLLIEEIKSYQLDCKFVGIESIEIILKYIAFKNVSNKFK